MMAIGRMKIGLGIVLAAVLLVSLGGLASLGRRPPRPLAAPAGTLVRHQTPSPSGPTTRTGAASAPAHLVLVVEENHELGQVVGSPRAPFLNRLVAGGTLLTRYYAVGHPSLPNYLALIGGDSFGIHRDCTSCQVHATSLVDQLERAGITWKAYYQALPAPGANLARAGAYTKLVDPFLYFDNIRTSPARRHRVVPLGQFNADLAANRLPRLMVVAPDLRHDMHSGSIAAGDRFLRRLWQRLSTSPAGPHIRLIVTFDEGTTHLGRNGRRGGGRVATVVIGTGVPAGARDSTPYDHYALLRSIERLYNLPALRHAADPGVATIPSVAGPASSSAA